MDMWKFSHTVALEVGYNSPLIEDGRMTLASLLKETGYDTACIGKWHLGLHWGWGLKEGARRDEDGNYLFEVEATDRCGRAFSTQPRGRPGIAFKSSMEPKGPCSFLCSTMRRARTSPIPARSTHSYHAAALISIDRGRRICSS